MQVGLVGLGRMGANIARRLCRADIHVVGYDANPAMAEPLAGEPGFQPAFSIDAMLLALKGPRIVWSMLPAGVETERLLDHLAATLAAGDRVIDGANGHYRVTRARAPRFAELGMGNVDGHSERVVSTTNQMLEEVLARVFTCAGAGLHDHRGTGLFGRLHDGLDLLQVVDVERWYRVVVDRCVVQQLAHRNECHGESPRKLKNRCAGGM